MDKLSRKVTRLYQWAAHAFLLLLFLSVFIQIIMRNIFNSGSIHLEELARLSLVSLVFLMIPVLSFEKKHIVVDIVLIYLPGAIKRRISAVVEVLVGLFGIYVLWAISTIMERNWSVRTPALALPNIVLYIPITLGILAMTILSFTGVWTILTAKKEGI